MKSDVSHPSTLTHGQGSDPTFSDESNGEREDSNGILFVLSSRDFLFFVAVEPQFKPPLFGSSHFKVTWTPIRSLLCSNNNTMTQIPNKQYVVTDWLCSLLLTVSVLETGVPQISDFPNPSEFSY